jgi:hypothetical protein
VRTNLPDGAVGVEPACVLVRVDAQTQDVAIFGLTAEERMRVGVNVCANKCERAQEWCLCE